MSARVVRYHGDALDVLAGLADDFVDAVVTDPPYELGFMGRAWDASGIAYNVELWKHCLRVLKPGGHLLAFGGTRTSHRLACAIEDAGFEVRDSIAWLYGSGFPKSLDVSKAIDKAPGRTSEAVVRLKEALIERFDASGMTRTAVDKACGFSASNYLRMPSEGKRPDPWINVLPSAEKWAVIRSVLGCDTLLDAMFVEAEREVIGQRTRKATGRHAQGEGGYAFGEDFADTAPATDDAKRWTGWGTALKPAHEPIVVARKPLVGTVAANVLAHGTGAINIDACRVEHVSGTDLAESLAKNPGRADLVTSGTYGAGRPQQSVNIAGRWPTNVVLDEVAAAELDEQSGTLKTGGGDRRAPKSAGTYGAFAGDEEPRVFEANEGGASRFFPVFRYQAKAPTRERPKVDGVAHPTVKPVELMRWLVRLVMPVDGIVLDPFAGSGTTLEAAVAEGMRCIGIEQSADYLPLIEARMVRAGLVAL